MLTITTSMSMSSACAILESNSIETLSLSEFSRIDKYAFVIPVIFSRDLNDIFFSFLFFFSKLSINPNIIFLNTITFYQRFANWSISIFKKNYLALLKNNRHYALISISKSKNNKNSYPQLIHRNKNE